jgi:hypothetical protein
MSIWPLLETCYGLVWSVYLPKKWTTQPCNHACLAFEIVHLPFKKNMKVLVRFGYYFFLNKKWNNVVVNITILKLAIVFFMRKETFEKCLFIWWKDLAMRLESKEKRQWWMWQHYCQLSPNTSCIFLFLICFFKKPPP